MTTVTDRPETTTYGGWRRRRGFEVLGFSSGQLGVLLTAVVVPLIVMLFAIRAGLVLGVPALVVIALVSWRTDGRPRVLLIAERQRWLRASGQGLTVTQSEVVQPLGRPAYLPGPMAALELLKVATPSGQPAGWVWDRQPGTLTAQLRTTSVGTLLADGADADNWVAQYGGWQASLGYVPGIRSITVVHETAPSSGHRVRDHVEARLDPAAPALARELMNMELANSPGRSAEIKQWVSVTIDTHKLQTRPSTLIDAVADASLTLSGVSESLSSGGVHVLGRATPTWITSRIRAAFDPASRGEIERELVDEAPLEWSEAGPFAAREMWDHLQHDSGFSVTLALRELPRSPVRHDVLRRLMAPGRWPRRVAMLYTPYPAETAEEIVDSEMTAAAVRESAARRTKRDFTIKEQMDARRAASAAIEQQQGAGLGELSLFVTVTTLTREDLALAVADVETRARGCRLRLVRMYGAQMIGFATTLGIGVDPFELAARTPGRRK